MEKKLDVNYKTLFPAWQWALLVLYVRIWFWGWVIFGVLVMASFIFSYLPLVENIFKHTMTAAILVIVLFNIFRILALKPIRKGEVCNVSEECLANAYRFYLLALVGATASSLLSAHYIVSNYEAYSGPVASFLLLYSSCYPGDSWKNGSVAKGYYAAARTMIGFSTSKTVGRSNQT